MLDQWVLKCYEPYGRGAILMKDPDDKRKKMKVGTAPLPHFWAKALVRYTRHPPDPTGSPQPDGQVAMES